MSRRLLLLLLLSVGLRSGVSPLQGATVVADERNWTLVSGASFRGVWTAEAATNTAWIRHAGDTQSVFLATNELCAADVAWLRAWQALVREATRLGARAPGTLRHYTQPGPPAADLYVYVPEERREGRPPLLFLFQTGGPGASLLCPFLAEAETVGIIVAASDTFHNTKTDWCEEDEVHLAQLKTQLERLDKELGFNPNRLFLGGHSGGAMTAYVNSTMLGRPCRGIFANGGWLGGEAWYGTPYAVGLRVAMVYKLGGNAARNWIEHDARILNSRRCAVREFPYQGPDCPPTPEARLSALRWLLEKDTAHPDETVMTSTNLPSRQQGLWVLGTCALQTEVNGWKHSMPGGWWAMTSTVASARETLSSWWGVEDRGDLLRALRSLQEEGHRKQFDDLAASVKQASQVKIGALRLLASNNPRASSRLEVVLQHAEALGDKSILAWDFDRYVWVCGKGYLAGYLTEEEYWQHVMPVARQLQSTFSSWEELGRNHLIGRSFWSYARYRDERAEWEAAYQNLMTNTTSPWVRLPWNLDLSPSGDPSRKAGRRPRRGS